MANTAKYVGDLPIIGVNPDPSRNDGVLLPFDVRDARNAVGRVIDDKADTRDVTLAEVNTNDGQRMLAFNDFFIGASSHVSARYTLETGGAASRSPPAACWLRRGGIDRVVVLFVQHDRWIRSCLRRGPGGNRLRLDWEDRRLAWAVREPFRSRHSRADLVVGLLEENEELVIGSQMPSHGVIFSDGVEDDFLEFSSGMIARFTVSSQRARLVVP